VERVEKVCVGATEKESLAYSVSTL